MQLPLSKKVQMHEVLSTLRLSKDITKSNLELSKGSDIENEGFPYLEHQMHSVEM
jgi:hypothetical protein